MDFKKILHTGYWVLNLEKEFLDFRNNYLTMRCNIARYFVKNYGEQSNPCCKLLGQRICYGTLNKIYNAAAFNIFYVDDASELCSKNNSIYVTYNNTFSK